MYFSKMMLPVPTLLIIALSIVVVLVVYMMKKNNKAKLPPGPPQLPFIGNLHQILTANTTLHIYLCQLSNKYGPIFHIKLGSIPVLVVSSAKLAKQVMNTQDSAFCSRPQLVAQQKLSYNGSDIAFSPPNNHWREMKKMVNMNLFTPAKFHSFRPIREDEISRLVANISGSINQVVNLDRIAMGFITALMCRISFGKRYEEQGRYLETRKDIRALIGFLAVSDYFPMFSFVDKLSGLMDRLDKAFNSFDLFYQDLIDDHLHPNRVMNTTEEEDILDILIKFEQHKPNWNTVKAMLMNIFFGGTDSTAASIVSIMTVLMKAPNVMKKAQAEIRNVVGKKGKVDEDDFAKLPYLNAVINETLRLYPPISMLPRQTLEKCNLDGYEIQPKSVVYVNAYAVARDPMHWENPQEFLPERFLNSNIDVKGQDYGLIPFGSGRRICPGVDMGLTHVKIAAANLLYSFDWELPPGIQPKDVDTQVLPGLVAHRKNALLLVPKKYAV